jgi:hypothetical protein
MKTSGGRFQEADGKRERPVSVTECPQPDKRGKQEIPNEGGHVMETFSFGFGDHAEVESCLYGRVAGKRFTISFGS